ncbi:tail fiber protein proximal subunit [Vibrio phage D479]
MAGYKKAFRATAGLDSAGQPTINVADPRLNEGLDAINQQFFIRENTVQEYDATRENYQQDFIVEFNNRLYKNITPITTAEPFNTNKWRLIRTDPSWLTTSTSTSATSGDYLYVTNSSAVTITLPSTPTRGDLVAVQDGLGQVSRYPITITSPGGNQIRYFDTQGVSATTTDYQLNRKRATIYFIFNGVDWTFQIEAEHHTIVLDENHPSQVPSDYITAGGYHANIGETLYLFGGAKMLCFTLPPFPNEGDVVVALDANLRNKETHALGKVSTLAPNDYLVDPFTGTKVKEFQSNASGFVQAIYSKDSSGDGVWSPMFTDTAPRWRHVGHTNTEQLVSRSQHSVHATPGVSAITLTLPEKPEEGDWLKVSNIYDPEIPVTIKVHPNFGQGDPDFGNPNLFKIVNDVNDFLNKKRSHYISLGETYVDSTIVPGDYQGWEIELVYYEKNWEWATVDVRVDVVDENYRSYPGIAPLATQADTNKQDYAPDSKNESPDKDKIVTPELLDGRRSTETLAGLARFATTGEVNINTSATHRDDLIVTPLKLNARTATETRRGLAEIATASEMRSTTLGTHIVTPQRFHAMQAEEGLTGVGRLVIRSNNISSSTEQVSSTANMRTSRPTNGANNTVFDHDDHLRFVTPKMLNEYRATQMQPGTLWVANNLELRVNDSTVDDAIITPRSLAYWKASDTIRGIARSATQAETNATSGSGESWTTVFVTPETLNNRTAAEARRGVAEIANQNEVDAGVDNSRIVAPLKLKTWLDRDHFSTPDSDGLSHTGTLWDDVAFTIAVSTETQRGTLEVATQSEANANSGGSDIHIITPKKLNARRATETLAGIAEIASTGETDSGTSDTRIITPAKLLRWTRTSANAEMTATRKGVGESATYDTSADSVWVEASVDGGTNWFDSSTDITVYGARKHNPQVVTPRGLNFALRNYVPIGARVKDTYQMNGLNHTEWARRTADQTITGTYTFIDNAVNIHGANPALTFRDTTDSDSEMQVYYQTGRIGFTTSADQWRFSVTDAGVAAISNTLTVNTAASNSTRLTVNGAIVENESSANGASPAAGTLRTKYLGISNNAVSASKWATARTLTLTGDVSGSVSFDGTSNVSITAVVANNSHTHTAANITSGTLSRDRLYKANRSTAGIVQVTNDARTADPSSASAVHLALSAGVGKELSERIDMFTPDGGTGDSVKYRDYVQVGSVRIGTNSAGVMEFTFGHPI